MKKCVIGLIFLWLAFSSAWCPRATAQVPPMPPQELPAGSEVLNRGPVNEAFAEPITLEDQGGLVVHREPPGSIEEVPPADRPQGNEYLWIPGYWAWDEDRNDFIWVGACWRIAPPKMYWVPGYWAQVSDGWEWVPGFWAPTSTREVQYFPAPPPPEDIQARGPPPDRDNIWVPGCWYWRGNQYVRRAGYWLPQRQGWVWAPSHYSWSPRGYIFVSGHWDYALDERGVMFAPIYFPSSVYDRRGFSYTPDIVIDLGAITISLFASPRYSHYYFGDYYDDSYVRMGIYPQFDSDRLHSWYDPIYVYDRWNYRQTDPQWGEHQQQAYDRFRQDSNSRPPRTYTELQTRMASVPEPQRRTIEYARPLQTVVSEKSTTIRFEKMTPDVRQKIANSGSAVQEFRKARVKWEAPAVVTQPARQNGRTAPPAQQAPTATPPREKQGPNVSSQQAPSATAPHAVRVTRPESVKVPSPPVVARTPGKSERSQHATTPPPPPKDERKTQATKTVKKQQGK